jgi:hypothetical protein
LAVETAMAWISRPTLEWLARWGYGARGVVYLLVGGLAVLAALGSGGQTGGSKSALETLLEQPFGWILLGAIALGLACFALWRVVESVTDADNLGSSARGIAVRAGRAIGGLVYVGLAVSALSLAFGWGAGSSDDRSAQDWTAWLLTQPFGRWAVGLIGLAIAGVGFRFLQCAWKGTVAAHLRCPAHTSRWVVPLGRFGFGGRGIVFLLIGGFLVLAAYDGNSSEARGLGGALQTLQAQPYGWILLALTAGGLAAFGIFGLVQAVYRHIDAPTLDDALPDAVQRSVRAG